MAENEQLRARIAELEDLLFGVRALPIEWGLTNKESRIFGVLVNRTIATRECVYQALYGYDQDGGLPENAIDTHVCKLRRKLKPFGIIFETRRYEGYILPEAVRARFRANPAPLLPRARIPEAALLAGAA